MLLTPSPCNRCSASFPAVFTNLAAILVAAGVGLDGVVGVGIVMRALQRDRRRVEVLGHELMLKVVNLPDGRRRAKPEFDDVQRVAQATGRPAADIFKLAIEAAERL